MKINFFICHKFDGPNIMKDVIAFWAIRELLMSNCYFLMLS